MHATALHQRSTERRFFGVVEAIVADVNDPEGEGRIKCTFPWLDEMTVSEWCRVSQFYAGPGYGAFWIPEVRDEVLVAFVHGLMCQPIVLGGLYNGKDKPSTQRKDDLDQKLFRTKAGHQILLDDSKDKHAITITTNGGHEANLSDFEKKVSLKTSGGHTIKLDDSGKVVSVKTSGGHTVKLDDSGTVAVEHSGGAKISMEAAQITIEAQQATVNASQINLGGDAAIDPLVLGQKFMALFNAHTHTIGPIPTTPPVTPMTPAVLSQTTKTT